MASCKQLLFDLNFAHAIPNIRKRLLENQLLTNVQVAEDSDKERNPLYNLAEETNENGRDLQLLESTDKHTKPEPTNCQPNTRYSCGGLDWVLPEDCKMEDAIIVWIGHESPALTNIMLTFNACTVGILFDVFYCLHVFMLFRYVGCVDIHKLGIW